MSGAERIGKRAMRPARNLREGPIAGHFRALAVPTAVGMIFTTLYNVVDVWYAGLLSTAAQAGLAITFQVFFILVAFGVGMSSGLSALIGNALGAGDLTAARRIACQGLGYAGFASALLGIGGIWASPMMLSLISSPGAYRDAANAYMAVLLLATPGFLLAFAANGILTAQGDTVSMQRAQIVAFFANLVLNPLFIFGLPGLVGGIGFNGIAAATVLSQTGVMVFILVRVMRSSVMDPGLPARWRPRLADWREITGQAMPATFAMLVMLIAGFVVQFYLRAFGPAAQAAYGVALRIEQLILLPGFGLTGALLPIVAQNYGAGLHDRVREALRFCAKAGVAMMLAGSLVLWFAARPAMALFSGDPEVIRIGGDYLHVDGFMLPVYILLFALNSFLQGLKRPVATVWIGLYRQGFGVAFFCYLFVTLFGLGTWGVWYAILVSVFTGLLLSFWVTARVARTAIGGLRG